MPEPLAEPLLCAEYGAAASGNADGWTAEIGDDPRDDDPPEVVILCPECWRREFGESESRAGTHLTAVR
jgi:hypothetical protein